MLSIEVYLNSVVIEGKVVDRPSRIAPSQWLSFWEVVLKIARKKVR